MNITAPKINDYIRSLLPHNDIALTEMEAFAQENDFPIIGPLVGPFLRQIALVGGARHVFELGSGYGYSAYWFAGGLKNGGRIICTDKSDENRNKAMGYFKRGGFESLIDFRVGDALEILSSFDGPFDIIFNDIDKMAYPQAFDLAIPRLRTGGIFITDNVLWSGKILNRRKEPAARAILEFNRKLLESGNLLSSIIPIRDGLGLAVKL